MSFCGTIFANDHTFEKCSKFNFAIDLISKSFAELNFAIWGQNRENKVRENLGI